jgi:hypothetical protein
MLAYNSCGARISPSPYELRKLLIHEGGRHHKKK